MSGDLRNQHFALRNDTAQGANEKFPISLGEAFHFRRISFDGRFIRATNTPLVKPLQDELARTAAGRLGWRLRLFRLFVVAEEVGH